MKQRIFIYGTLKRGGSNAHYMAGQEFVGEAQTERLYRLVDCGGYPGMFLVREGGVSIHGEVWDVDEACRARLDVLEDVAGGEYALTGVQLMPPFAGPGMVTYLHLRANTSMPDAGNNWRG
jgi:gamma-glutamylaminecyclotransferase